MKVKLIPGYLRDKCAELLKDWDNLPKKRVY